MLQDLCETLIVYIFLSTFQLIHMVLNVNKPDVRKCIAWIESAYKTLVHNEYSSYALLFIK